MDEHFFSKATLGNILPNNDTYLTGPYSLSCKQKISMVFGICPIIPWYLGYLKQEKTKNSSEKSFREERSSYLLSEMGRSGFFSEPFNQIKKVRTFLMQNWPMANNIFLCDYSLQLFLHTLHLVILVFLSRELLYRKNFNWSSRKDFSLEFFVFSCFRYPRYQRIIGHTLGF